MSDEGKRVCVLDGYGYEGEWKETRTNNEERLRVAGSTQ